MLSDMMNLLNGGSSNLAIYAVLMFVLFWAGVFLIAVYLVSTAKDEKFKTYLIAGLALVIGTLFISSVVNGSMMKNFFSNDMMKRDFKQMMQDEDVKKEFKSMMNGSSGSEEETPAE